jgi:glycosyltransferase involved in cell wall biosynthesis
MTAPLPAGPGGPAPRATVVITTKDRKDELARAITSALAQTVPCEVLVIDDGSTDGTAEAVRASFPAVRLQRHEESAGYIVRRNEAARLARAPIVISIDDDATFASPRTVEQTLREFDHPRTGAVAVPFIDVRVSPAVRQAAPDDRQTYLTHAFIGTAHALRRDLFLHLGGYREFLFHQGEEGDYCLRMLQAGYVTRLGRADPIHHHESLQRDLTRMDVYGRRNDLLFIWYNVPLRYLPVHAAGTVFNGLRHGVRCGRLGNMVRGLVRGFGACCLAGRDRRPVPRDVYRLMRHLKARAAVPLAEVEARLPPAVGPAGPGRTGPDGNNPDTAPSAPQLLSDP